MLGVSLAANKWLEMTGLIVVGLIPFAALGIALGHMLTIDAIGWSLVLSVLAAWAYARDTGRV